MKKIGNGVRRRKKSDLSENIPPARWDGMVMGVGEVERFHGLNEEQVLKIINRLGGLDNAIRFAQGL